MKPLVLVIGCHRSGTSATAGTLAEMGVDFGSRLMPPSPANPKGYFESLDIVRAHDSILGMLGCAWDKPATPPMECWPKGVKRRALVLLGGAVRRLTGEVVGVKDPRASLFVPLWDEVCRRNGFRLHLLHSRRSPEAVVESLVSRDGIEYTRARAIERAYTFEAGRAVEYFGGCTLRFPTDHAMPEAWEGAFRSLGLPLEVRAPLRFFDRRLVHHA